MAVIYLRHQEHGCKVACSEDEAIADEKLGWTRYEVNASPQPAEEKRAQEVGDINVLRKQYKERFGKPPHALKKADTLKKELEAA